MSDIQKFLTSKSYLTDRDVDDILGKKTISAIQRYLNDSGYDSGKIDGIIGEKTKAALSQYNKGIKYTGVTKKYIEKLRYESDPEHKVKSIASTNYSRVGEIGRMLIPNNITEDPVMNMNIIGRGFTRLLDASPDIAQSIANVAFDKFSRPTTAYVGAARKYMKQIK